MDALRGHLELLLLGGGASIRSRVAGARRSTSGRSSGIAVIAVLGSVLAVDWHDRVPWAPSALQLLGPAHLVLVAAAALEFVRGARLSRA